MTPIIDVQNLNFSFGTGELKRPILKSINLTLNRGEIVIVTGPSGSGKTTLLTIIGALRGASEGSVKILGQELVNSDEKNRTLIRRNIGYIFQHHNLLKSLTALQNVCMALEFRQGLNEEERNLLASEVLTSVGLKDKINYKPESLSGGQKQRVSIARALVAKPQIILADEPTASLDKKSGQDAVHILTDLAKKQQTTILLVTHDYRILDIADRIINLEDGELIVKK
jgi:putative ABC transport system ATP-binding protein